MNKILLVQHQKSIIIAGLLTLTFGAVGVSAAINTALRPQTTPATAETQIEVPGKDSRGNKSGVPSNEPSTDNEVTSPRSGTTSAQPSGNFAKPPSQPTPKPSNSSTPTPPKTPSPTTPSALSNPSTPTQPGTPAAPTCQNGYTGTYPNCIAPAPTPVGIAGSWRLILQDEFNGSSLNTAMWTPQRGPSYSYGDPYNPQYEDAYYLANNPKVASGNLVLTLNKGSTNNYPYSSGMVQNGRNFSYKYGYVESRIKVPGATGVWPAFWTLSAPVDQQWPPEIDIFEFGLQGQSRPSFNYHYGTSSNHQQTGLTLYGNSAINYSQDFHTYGMFWSANRIQVYVDGNPGPSYTVAANITNIPQYIILNLGLSKGANVASGTAMYIDYVRVWQ